MFKAKYFKNLQFTYVVLNHFFYNYHTTNFDLFWFLFKTVLSYV